MMAKETILVVDDEEDIVDLIKFNLDHEGYQVLTAGTGEEAMEITISSRPDLLVLDLMLPGIDGLDVTRYLRSDQRIQHIPIIMLTAKGDDEDVIVGLESGVNDYMSKPFSPRELIARIRAILRRRKKNFKVSERERDSKKGLVIDEKRHRVTIDGKEIKLTLTEFELLSFLSSQKGWVFSRGQIVDAIHGENYAVTDRSIDVIIVGLRKKLKSYSKMIETVRGLGYRYRDDRQ